MALTASRWWAERLRQHPWRGLSGCAKPPLCPGRLTDVAACLCSACQRASEGVGIAQAEVESLSGERVHSVSGVTAQRGGKVRGGRERVDIRERRE